MIVFVVCTCLLVPIALALIIATITEARSPGATPSPPALVVPPGKRDEIEMACFQQTGLELEWLLRAYDSACEYAPQRTARRKEWQRLATAHEKTLLGLGLRTEEQLGTERIRREKALERAGVPSRSPDWKPASMVSETSGVPTSMLSPQTVCVVCGRALRAYNHPQGTHSWRCDHCTRDRAEMRVIECIYGVTDLKWAVDIEMAQIWTMMKQGKHYGVKLPYRPEQASGRSPRNPTRPDFDGLRKALDKDVLASYGLSVEDATMDA